MQLGHSVFGTKCRCPKLLKFIGTNHLGTLCPASKLVKFQCWIILGRDIQLWELISKRVKDVGTICSWDLWFLGQNVVGTFGLWDNSLFFGTHMTYALGQKVLGQNVIGTIYLGAQCQWDNSPRGQSSLGQFTQGQSPRDNRLGTFYSAPLKIRLFSKL